jgi:hypothetical protein
MSNLKQALQTAMNCTNPMRGLDKNKWIFAGSFEVDNYAYAFYADVQLLKATIRCTNSRNYANHWFDIDVDYDHNDNHIVRVL